MQCTWIGEELEVCASRLHLLFERLNLFGGDEFIIASMEHEDLCFDVADLRRLDSHSSFRESSQHL